MKKLLKWALPCLCFATLFIGCDDDNSSAERQGKPVAELTPEENKKELEDIGLKVLAKINPKDHEQLIKTVDKLSELVDNSDIEIERNINAVAKNIKRICEKNDLGQMAAFTKATSELYAAAQYYGKYTYNEKTQVWDRTDMDNSLEFHFNANNKKAIIKATCSGKEVAIKINDDNDEVNIPEHVEVILTLGNDELCKVTAESKLDKSSHSANVSTKLSAGQYTFNCTVNATEQQANAEYNITISNETIISAKAQVNGQHMTNPSDSEIDNPENLFNSASASVNILDEANITASCPNIKQLVKDIDAIDYDNDYTQEGNKTIYDKESSQKEAELYNKYLKAELRYVGSDDVIANFGFQTYKDEEGWGDYLYEYWEVEPIIIFTQDDSKYSFEEYFDDNVSFQKLIDSIEDLGDQYEKYLDYLK